MHQVCPHCGTKNRFAPEAVAHEVNCGRCGQALLPAKPVELGDAQLLAYLKGTDMPVVVDFWAPWCGPCRMMAPHFEQAARDMPHIRFVKVNSDEAPQASAQFGIRSIPTLIVFSQGKEVERVSGAMPLEQLKKWIQPHAHTATA